MTRRESEIAALAAEGLASQEIASRLMVSIRTVDNHLLHAYAKLGIDSRTQLRVALAALAEVDVSPGGSGSSVDSPHRS